MLSKCKIVRREGGAAGTSLFACLQNKSSDIPFIEEQIIPVDNCLFAIHWHTLIRPQLQFTRRVRRKDIPLMQPEGMVLDSQVPGRLVERCNGMGGVKDNF